jgi:hypothetical protein
MRALSPNGLGTLGMLSSGEKATRYRQQAARLRDIVTLSRSDATLKEQLIDLAGQYERLAERAVGLQRPAEGRQFGYERRS